MFKMLVFILALDPLLIVFYLALVNISSGKVSEGLPYAAISLMSLSYFVKGACEAASYIKSRLK